MRIVEFYCKKCDRYQEKWLKRLDSENTDRCEHCNSPPEELKRSEGVRASGRYDRPGVEVSQGAG